MAGVAPSWHYSSGWAWGATLRASTVIRPGRAELPIREGNHGRRPRTEISATSTSSFEDAIRQGLERATKTLRGVTSAWIKDQRVKLENGQVAEYQVNMEVTFVLEG